MKTIVENDKTARVSIKDSVILWGAKCKGIPEIVLIPRLPRGNTLSKKYQYSWGGVCSEVKNEKLLHRLTIMVYEYFVLLTTCYGLHPTLVDDVFGGLSEFTMSDPFDGD
jgi:hypothetical protein